MVVGPVPPPVHGASRVTEAVVAELQARTATGGPRVTVVSTAGDVAGGALRYHGSRLVAHARAGRHLAASVSGPVVLYIGGAGGAGLWYQAGLVALARAVGTRVVFHHHSGAYTGAARPAMRAIVSLMGRRGVHVCLSPGMTATFERDHRPGGTVVTVSNARFVPDAPPVREAPRPRCLRLVHVSNLSIEKGTVRVIEAFDRLRGRGVDVTLDLVGDADERVGPVIERALRQHPGSFRHHGRGSRDDVFRVLEASDLFVFPTTYRYEAQPLVVLEALSCGVPVLASRHGALGDVLPAPWLLDATDSEPALDGRIAEFVGSDPHRTRAEARAAFERSRRSGTDLVHLLAAHGSEG